MSAMEKLREHWLGFVTTGLVGGLVLGVFAGYGALTRLETRQQEMGERLNRIAAALPDMSVRIAMEQINRPVDGAVVVAGAVKRANGDWVSPVHLFIMASKSRETYWVPIQGPDDKTASFLASGIVVTHDKGALSMKEASTYSSLSKEPAAVPGWVVADSSFLLFKGADEVQGSFNATLKDAFPLAKTEGGTVRASVGSWKELSQELTKNSSVYMAAKE